MVCGENERPAVECRNGTGGYGSLFEYNGEFFFKIDNHECDITDGSQTFMLSDFDDAKFDQHFRLVGARHYPGITLQMLAEHYLKNPPDSGESA